jgi:ABC-type polysaccharide transport system permease subunit
MYIVLQVAYVLYKDFQILILSRLVSFPNLCKIFVLNQQLNLTDYSMSANYGLLSSLIYTLFLYFL